MATLRESNADYRKFYVHSGTSTLTLRAESKEDRWVWMQALQTRWGGHGGGWCLVDGSLGGTASSSTRPRVSLLRFSRNWLAAPLGKQLFLPPPAWGARATAASVLPMACRPGLLDALLGCPAPEPHRTRLLPPPPPPRSCCSKGSWEGVTPAEASALKRDAAARIVTQDEVFMSFLQEASACPAGSSVPQAPGLGPDLAGCSLT